jgi:peroxiredoxin
MRPVERVAPLPNYPAPEFSLSAIDGSQISLSRLRGRIVLLNFWATWCVPCRAEMPDIQAAYEAYQGYDFTVLAINQGEGNEVVSRFVQDLHLTFPILLDRDGITAERYRVRGLPTSFIIDREGVIRSMRIGAIDRAYIESQLATLGIQIKWALSAIGSPAQINLDEIFPPGEERDLVLDTCLACHDVRTFGVARKTRDGWERNRASHSERFSQLSNTTVQAMYEYLIANFSPDKPISKQVPPTFLCGT